ncbi:MAG: Dna2/Cas4 domain-containing protein [Candidatus Nanoarchaeia archaeon]|nr:Dna2/Cas4 domain-containing protein [Candidatus Nanoarchaeia archaeon]|tara:strand:- start:9725 stop:10465 length:741 start_codon:yes stop_codon:yes gene_type:complete
MSKILCPDGVERHIDEVRGSEFENYPNVVLKALLAGQKPRKKKDPNKKPRFGVTRLTGLCLRKSYYDLTEEVPISLEKLWIFSRGHAIHNFFQEHIPEKENEVFLQAPFSAFSAIGFVDVFSNNILYEFKTTERIPKQPKKEHTMQLQSYFSMLPESQQKDVKKLVIVYFSLSKIKTFEVEKRNMLGYLEARGTILANALKTSTPPPREESYLCNYCEFYDICFRKKKSNKTAKKQTQTSLEISGN